MLQLDIGKKEGGNFIKAIEVQFKAKSGEYSYYDGSTDVVDSVFDGIVVGSGFQFQGTSGNPTKKKSVNYLSDDFNMDILKNWLISIREFSREGANKSNRPLGKKTYQEWKDAGYKLVRTVFVVRPNELDTVYKLVFSAVASIPVGKQITPDMPNFVTLFGVDEHMFETENGEFYVPTLTKTTPISTDIEEKVGEWLRVVKRVLSKKEENKIETPSTEVASAEDHPF